jgi:hypothetical protein
MPDSVRIGCGCGFWGDSAAGPAQLVRHGDIQVLVLDYLSEITLSLLARMRARRPELGYTGDFVTEVLKPLAADIATRGIKVVANAGGVNPSACASAVRALLQQLGVRLSVGVVQGDDVMDRLEQWRREGRCDLEGQPLPQAVQSANAYLGAWPIAQALSAGADIVITGRCADSALALGPLLHFFGWQSDDFDRLALGSLAGHIIECGPQATGGIFTDWRSVAAGWHDMGYPIVECARDGSFIVTKPRGSGGRVVPATVAEQITYEVHDPGRYILPDVVCDFREVRLEDLGADRVRVIGARGLPPTPDYKLSLTHADGYRCLATLMIVGPEARARAEQVGAAILKRTRRLLGAAGWAEYRQVSIEVLGAEALYGPHAQVQDSREVILKVAATHSEERALEIFAREIYPAATSMAQGITGFAGGRPAVQPIVRLCSCLVPKSEIAATVEVDGQALPALPSRNLPAAPTAVPQAHAAMAALESAPTGPRRAVPLLRLAHGRSGDKGDTANIGILARRREFCAVLAAELTAHKVRDYLGHLVEGEVERYDWPGLDGWNFVLHRALGGGGVASLRYDPQGKGLAQILMDFPVPVPQAWLQPGGFLAEASA